jgi:hypothetical protein
MMYGYQPSTPADRILPLVGAIVDAANRLTLIADIRNVIYQVIKLSKEKMSARSTTTAPSFQP